MFDARGNIVKVQDGVGNNLNVLTILDRGYTGHEHLQSVGLINMNGRIYDAKLHRFLQPDNFVQDPFNTQNYNRYGYCINNPLKYTDINGEWFGIDDAIAGLIGGVVNWATHGFQFNGAGAAYFGIGAAAGITTLYGGPLAGAAVLGVGNSLTDQVSTTGTVDFGRLIGDTTMSLATAYIGGQITQGISPYIDKTVGQVVKNSILKESLTQGVTNSFGGFIIGTGVAKASGASFNDAIDSGWGQAKMGFAMGVTSGAIKGYIDVKASKVSNADVATRSQAEPTNLKNTATIDGKLIDWIGYPEGELKPMGNLKTLEGSEYEIARKSANSMNSSLRRSNPEFFKGLEIHEIQPIKFNGSPTDFSNKLFLTREEHIKFTNYWNKVLRNK